MVTDFNTEPAKNAEAFECCHSNAFESAIYPDLSALSAIPAFNEFVKAVPREFRGVLSARSI